jgi:hypothetical protein
MIHLECDGRHLANLANRVKYEAQANDGRARHSPELEAVCTILDHVRVTPKQEE